MKTKLKYLAAVGTIVLMVSLLHFPYTKDATPSPENRPVCDLNRGSEDVPSRLCNNLVRGRQRPKCRLKTQPLSRTPRR